MPIALYSAILAPITASPPTGIVNRRSPPFSRQGRTLSPSLRTTLLAADRFGAGSGPAANI